ncbi:MAG: aldehyde dehydrogenase family protein, partial [Clostridia bacterium]|nr:aldehyde dehydrogenase family protein [Clostridia bacterium]
MGIEKIVKLQREFFDTHATLDYRFRIEALKKLKKAIEENENKIAAALKSDLGKSGFESFMCEVGMTLSELSFMIKNLKKLMRKKRISTPIMHFPAKSYQVPSPMGVVLIMSPWNYPFMLALEPLVDAIASGNTVVLKPGSYAANTCKVIKEIISAVFEEKYVVVVEGGRETNQALLDQKFDYIFFTGSKSVGGVVLEKAAKNLTPVTLELGGKSPCIVDKTANLKLAAKRIVFGKFLNCGQTCVAPDYLLVEECVKDTLVRNIVEEIRLQFGTEPLANKDYGKIINKKHFDRLTGLIKGEKIVIGGKNDGEQRIEPTVLDGIHVGSPCMQEEIFGP